MNLETAIKKIETFDFKSLNVAAIYGGNFPESDVSRSSMKSIEPVLSKIVGKLHLLEFNHDLVNQLQTIRPDVIFNAMHGTWGEDGRLPVLLDYLQLKYTHSGHFASTTCMNKDITKYMVSNHSISTPKGFLVKKNELTEDKIHQYFSKLGDKIVIKPVDGGSSIGVSILAKENELNLSSTLSWDGNDFLVEEFIDGLEISVPVLMGTALGVIELVPKTGFYDYENKYKDGKTEHIFPARIPAPLYEKALHYATLAHNIAGCKTVSRSDLRVDIKRNEVYFMEINTHPGMTPLSLVPEVAKAVGIDFEKLLKILLYDACSA